MWRARLEALTMQRIRERSLSFNKALMWPLNFLRPWRQDVNLSTMKEDLYNSPCFHLLNDYVYDVFESKSDLIAQTFKFWETDFHLLPTTYTAHIDAWDNNPYLNAYKTAMTYYCLNSNLILRYPTIIRINPALTFYPNMPQFVRELFSETFFHPILLRLESCTIMVIQPLRPSSNSNTVFTRDICYILCDEDILSYFYSRLPTFRDATL